MTTTELLSIHAKLIKQYAQVALRKLKKPTICNVNDMYQEGVIAFLGAEVNYDETRGASFKTFLITCLRQHFSDLITQSYRKKETANSALIEQTVINKRENLYRKIFQHTADTFEIVQMQFLLKDFTEDEIKYIDMIISLVNIARRSRRKRTRENLGISYEREMALRRSIHDKIKK